MAWTCSSKTTRAVGFFAYWVHNFAAMMPYCSRVTRSCKYQAANWAECQILRASKLKFHMAVRVRGRRPMQKLGALMHHIARYCPRWTLYCRHACVWERACVAPKFTTLGFLTIPASCRWQDVKNKPVELHVLVIKPSIHFQRSAQPPDTSHAAQKRPPCETIFSSTLSLCAPCSGKRQRVWACYFRGV